MGVFKPCGETGAENPPICRGHLMGGTGLIFDAQRAFGIATVGSFGGVGSDNQDLPVFPNPVRREMTMSSLRARSRVRRAIPSSLAASSIFTVATSPSGSSRFRKAFAFSRGFWAGGV